MAGILPAIMSRASCMAASVSALNFGCLMMKGNPPSHDRGTQENIYGIGNRDTKATKKIFHILFYFRFDTNINICGLSHSYTPLIDVIVSQMFNICNCSEEGLYEGIGIK